MSPCTVSSNYPEKKKLQHGAQIQSMNVDSKDCEGVWSKHLKQVREKSKSLDDCYLDRFSYDIEATATEREFPLSLEHPPAAPAFEKVL